MSRWRRIIALIFLVAVVPTQAAAINSTDLHAVVNDTVFYSATDGSCDSGTTVALVGNDNIEKAFNYFNGKGGLTAEQAAGIVGNLEQESHLNPRSVQGGGGPGRGIAQWSLTDRWAALQNWASGRDIYDLATQLDYIWYEMKNVAPWDKTLGDLKATTTVDDATQTFELDFEKAGDPNMAQRISYARDALKLYGGSASTDTSSASGILGCGGGLGINGNFVFPELTTQAAITTHDPHWCYTSQTSCHHDYLAADIFNNEGTANVAAVAGTVIKAVDTSCHGGFDVPRVQIMGTDGKYYYYTHMKPGSIKVSTGQKVNAGQQLGVIGPKECAENTTPHLHFQMSSVPINNTQDTTERTKYIDPQPNLVAAFNKLPKN